jgi:hypothetical protein
VVIKEIVVSRISREPSGEPIRCPEALNIPSQLLRTPRVCSKGEYSSDQQKRMCCMTRWVCGALTLRMA